MGFIDNLKNNTDLFGLISAGAKAGESIKNFVKENEDEIKSIFTEAKKSVEEGREEWNNLSFGEKIKESFKPNSEKCFSVLGWGVYKGLDSIAHNDKAKELKQEFLTNLKGDMQTWVKEETLIGDLITHFNKDKNIEAEG